MRKMRLSFNTPLLLLLFCRGVAGFTTPQLLRKQQPQLLFQSSRSEEYGFEELKSLDSRLSILEENAPDLLGSFYESKLKSFSVKPGSAEVCTNHVVTIAYH